MILAGAEQEKFSWKTIRQVRYMTNWMYIKTLSIPRYGTKVMIEIVCDGIVVSRSIFAWAYSNKRAAHMALDDKEMKAAVTWLVHAYQAEVEYAFHPLISQATELGNRFIDPTHMFEIMNWRNAQHNLFMERQALWGSGAMYDTGNVDAFAEFIDNDLTFDEE